MANYPKAKSRSKAVKAKQPSKSGLYASMLFAFIVGYALAWFYAPEAFLDWLLVQKNPHQMTSEVAAKEVAIPKPKFEFYTLLTQEKQAGVASPPMAAAAKAPKPVPVKPKPSATMPVTEQVIQNAGYHYFVQLASFHRVRDAEEMKAKLIMRGIDAQIRSVSSSGNTWYRVVVGPFDVRPNAEKAQVSIAKSERISGLVIRVDT